MSENMKEESFEICDRCLVIHGKYDMDHHNAMKIRTDADRMIDNGNIKYVIFDFSGVDFMDSSGIGLIMGRYKKVIFTGGKCLVCNVGENVDRIFRMSGIYKIIPKCGSVDEAVMEAERK